MPDGLEPYGGVSFHEQSHGESFISLVTNRFGPDGLYFLDEPEAALSIQGNLALMRRMHDLIADGSQFVVSTTRRFCSVTRTPASTSFQIPGSPKRRTKTPSNTN
jgi:predicted ATPase